MFCIFICFFYVIDVYYNILVLIYILLYYIFISYTSTWYNGKKQKNTRINGYEYYE